MRTRSTKWGRLLCATLLVAACAGAIQGPDVGQGDVQDTTALDDAVVDGHTDASDQADASVLSVEAPWTISGGDQVMAQISSAPFSIELKRDGEPLWVLDTGSFEVGFVPVHDPELSYDPYWLYFSLLGSSTDPPEGLIWGTLESVDSFAQLGPDGEHRLNVVWTTGHTGRVILGSSAPGSVSLTFHFDDPEQVAFIRIKYDAAEDENFYGLGESFDHVARKGTYRAMQFEPLLNSESGYNEAHVPVPFLISTRGPALFVESRYPMFFDVGYSDPSLVQVEVGQQEPLTLHLIGTDEPMGAIGVYHQLTGRPLVPPFWAFAPHFWRNETTGQGEVEEDLADIRALDFPAGVFWIDRPYQQNYNDCIFDPERYPDPESMLQTYRDKGFKLVLWHAPYTSEDSDAWETCQEQGYFVDGPVFFDKFGLLMDFTNPGAVELWQDLLRRFVDLGGPYKGASGYKLDYAEDVQVGLSGQRFNYSFFDGSDGLTMHHYYSYLYQKTYLDSLKPAEPRADGSNPHYVDGFVMGRTGTYGGQTVVHALWPGDLDNDDHFHMEEDYWVGGLPASVVASLSLGASGYPFYAADTGGYRGGRPTGEILVRWAWNTALSAIMQIGGAGSSHFPWAPGNDNEPQYDELVVERVRAATKLNMQLASYRFTWGLFAHYDGIPLLRPIGLAYPDDGRHPDDAYLLGPDLLVAPFVRADPQRTVPIPEGRWVEFFDHSVVVGPTEVQVPLTLDSVPLYLRTGAIIPLLPEEVDSLIPSSDEETTSLSAVQGRVSYLVVPGEEASFTNHDGSACSLFQGESGTWSVQLKPGELYQDFDLEVRYGAGAEDLPGNIEVDGVGVPWVENKTELEECLDICALSDSSTGRVWVHLGLVPGESGITVGLNPQL
jgi:alpha-D-xyloside xylohydrolase